MPDGLMQKVLNAEYNKAIEDAASKLKEWYPDNANTNAFAAAIRSLKRSVGK